MPTLQPPTEGALPFSLSAPPIKTPPSQSRWRAAWPWFAIASVLGVVGAVMAILLTHVPEFYQSRVSEGATAERERLSKDFLKEGTRFLSDIQNLDHWTASFHEAEINAWLAEDFEANHASQSLPAGVREPRLSIEAERLKLGFRYQLGPFSTIVQIAIRAWVPKNDLLALELQGAWAGALPLPTTNARRAIEQLANANSWEVTWKRNGRFLVALLRFPRGHREVMIQRIDIRDGEIFLKGMNGRFQFADVEQIPPQ